MTFGWQSKSNLYDFSAVRASKPVGLPQRRVVWYSPAHAPRQKLGGPCRWTVQLAGLL